MPLRIQPRCLPDNVSWLEAAEGWAELLAFGEAAGELAKIHPNFRDHPDVLEIRWLLAANTKKWTEALAVAKAIVNLAPEKPSGWVYQVMMRPASCCARLKGTLASTGGFVSVRIRKASGFRSRNSRARMSRCQFSASPPSR